MVLFVQVMSILVNLFVPVHLCFKQFCPSNRKKKKNLYQSKPVCSRNISSSGSIHLSIVCQSRSNVGPSKPVCPSKLVRKPVCKPVCPSNVTPSKLIRPTNASLSKTALPSKVYSSKTVCPSSIYLSKPVCLSNICLSKPACAFTVFPSKPICPSKPVRPSYVYSSEPV